MPIAGGNSLLQNQLKSSLSLQQGAQIKTSASLISAGIASIVPMGLLPSAPSPIPLTPAGLSAGMNMIEQALSLDKGATISTVASLLANGISLIAPLAPPAGLSILSQLIESALSLDVGADIGITSAQIASAIITYYTCGGII